MCVYFKSDSLNIGQDEENRQSLSKPVAVSTMRKDMAMSDDTIQLQNFRVNMPNDPPQVDFKFLRFPRSPPRSASKTPLAQLSIDHAQYEANLRVQLEDKQLEDSEETLSDPNFSSTLELANECKVNVLLIYAASKGNSHAVTKIMEKSTDSTPEYQCHNLNALQVAIAYGHSDCIEAILRPPLRRRKWLESKFYGFSLIHFAVFHKNVHSLEILLDYCNNEVKGSDENFIQDLLNQACDHTPHYTALHIAARQDLPDMVSVLIERGADKDAKLAKSAHTPLHLAALSKSTRAAEKLIEKGASLTAKTADYSLTALSLVASKTPRALDAITPMLNARIRLDEDEDAKRLVLDFSNLQKSPDDFEMSLLSCFVTCEETKFLQHPLCQALLDKNWERVRLWFFMRLFHYSILLTSLTTYIMAFHAGLCTPPAPRYNYESITCPGNLTLFEHVNHNDGLKIFINAAYVLVIPLTIIDIIRKMIGFFSFANSPSTPTMLRTFLRYLQQFENYFEWFCLIATLYLFYTKPVHGTWHDRLAPLIILLAWANFMILLGQLPFFGVYVEMYLSVLKEFLKLLMAYVCLLIGYSISFFMIFKTKDPFSNPLKAIWKTMAMMIGELEYNDLFEQDGATKQDMDFLSSVAVQIIFLTFIFTIAIVLMNLLIGIVVHDVNEIKKSALATKLKRKVDLVEYLDTTSGNILFVFTLLRKVTCYDSLRNCSLMRRKGQRRCKVDTNENQDKPFIVTYTQPKHGDFDSEALCEALKIALENKEVSLSAEPGDEIDSNNFKRAIDNLQIMFRRNNAKIVQLSTELNQLVAKNNLIAQKLKK